MSDYINELNESQRAAVIYNEGPSLVIAGAGSGKTRVLTYKIAYLLEQGYKPWHILALTFTNKAAREMKERIARQMGEENTRRLWMGTFHSIFLRILHAEAETLGFSPNFTIYDTDDSRSLIRTILKEMQLDEKIYKPGLVQSRISNAKNRLITPATYANSRESYEADQSARIPAVRDIYRRYWERCRQSDAMDFDDLLLYTFLLFRDHPDILEKYREHFQYILVDEYQDTNFAQHSIVLQLAQKHRHICVVGDDAQSIYSFRGADIDNILTFTKSFPGTQIFKLEQNYRSTQTIVSAANSLIEKNQRQIHKNVFSEKEKGDVIDVFQAYSDVEEGEIVANKITQLHRQNDYHWEHFAILYRTNAQSRIFEEALRKRSIPYRIYGGLSFYQRKEIKDVIAYFRLVVNPNDEEALKRIINYPGRGIGTTTINKILEAANKHHTSLWNILSSPAAFDLNLNKGTAAKLQGFRELIEGFMQLASQQNAYETGTEIIRQSGIIADICQDNSPENLSRKENVEELANGLSDFCARRLEEGEPRISLADFLSEVSLLTDQDTDKDGNEDRITLMTVHSAKGLEFKNVFVVGLEEGLFPSNMAGDSLRALEEERRLFYVAITRAEEHCYLSYAKTRIRYGKMEFGSPSRFLHDIDTCYLSTPESESRSYHKQASPSSHLFPSRQTTSVSSSWKRIPSNGRPAPKEAAQRSGSHAQISEGQTIEHERFGIGQIIHIEGSGENTKATIRFQNVGEKQLLVRYARFKVIK